MNAHNTLTLSACQVAQELVKISGKFTPIQQYFNYHGFLALPDENLSEEETAPIGSRYDDFIAIYGKTMQERLGACCGPILAVILVMFAGRV